MKRLYCRSCRQNTPHKIWRDRKYVYNGEEVVTCRKCGALRTKNTRSVTKGNAVHKIKDKKFRTLKQEQENE